MMYDSTMEACKQRLISRIWGKTAEEFKLLILKGNAGYLLPRDGPSLCQFSRCHLHKKEMNGKTRKTTLKDWKGDLAF